MGPLTGAQAEALLAERPMFRRPRAERHIIADAFVGRHVMVEDDVHRDGSWLIRHVGTFVGLARPTGAGSADLAIVDEGGGQLVAISSARVSRIELA